MAAPIWTQYMDTALKYSYETGTLGKDQKFNAAPIKQFNGRDNTGDKPGDGVSPSASAPPSAPASGGPGGPAKLDVPAHFMATAISDTSVQLNWDALPGLHYRVFRDNIALGALNPGFTDNGLAPGSFHTYTVSAYDDLGDSSDPAQQQVTLTGGSPPPASPPPAPSNAVAVPSVGKITVNWDAGPNGTTYQIEIFRGLMDLGSQTVNSNQFVLNNPQVGKTYKFVITAIKDGQNSQSTTTAPVIAV